MRWTNTAPARFTICTPCVRPSPREMTEDDWAGLSVEDRFRWYRSNVYGTVDSLRHRASHHLEVETETLNSEATRQKLADFVIGRGAIAPSVNAENRRQLVAIDDFSEAGGRYAMHCGVAPSFIQRRLKSGGRHCPQGRWWRRSAERSRRRSTAQRTAVAQRRWRGSASRAANEVAGGCSRRAKHRARYGHAAKTGTGSRSAVVTQAADEGFGKGVLHRFARRDVMPLDLVVVYPSQNGVRSQLGTVAHWECG
jgi:hypothetical protein